MDKAPKSPKIKHLPWSKTAAGDDKYFDRIEDAMFYGSDDVVVTEKMDGSNVCLTRKHLFARSHGHEPEHSSFDMLKKTYHERVKYQVSKVLAVYGEWLYAKHSVTYTSLPSYLLVFGVLDMRKKTWLSHDAVVEVSEALGLRTVPMVCRGAWSDRIRDLSPEGKSEYGKKREGLVIRYGGPFPFDDFDRAVGKVVRDDHVQTDEHWKQGEIERNKRKGSE